MQAVDHLIAEKHVLEGNDDILAIISFTGVYIQWYHQYPKSRPSRPWNPGFHVSIFPSDTQIQAPKAEKKPEDLKISAAAVSDSAVYNCALRPTVTGNRVTMYNNPLLSKESAYILRFCIGKEDNAMKTQ